jgi:ubiquinol-cytochrome c reductase cytochrome c1 subunit
MLIKKLLSVIALTVACVTAQAAGGDYALEKAPNRLTNQAALQNGAKMFVNYCLNCHAATSMRYNKLRDIGLTDTQIKDNLLFSGEKVGDLMKVAMTSVDAKTWFGAPPPDLSVIARAKATINGPSGADYIYTYLRTYYRDTTKPTGWNNLAFPNAGMPHVLWERQGPREYTSVVVHEVEKDGKKSWERVTKVYGPQGYWTATTEPMVDYTGKATSGHGFKALDKARATAYDSDIADLTAFLTWMSEPAQLLRKQIGVWVLLFLGIFFVVAWRLNASYWKHVK